MTWNSLTKFIKVACADVGFVFVGVFPKKNQNPKLKQEIWRISKGLIKTVCTRQIVKQLHM